MSWTCPRCQQPVFFAEKVSSLGKNWHRFCLKCERCHSVLSPGGHAEVRPGQGTQPCVCHCPPGTSPQFQPWMPTKGNLSSQLPRPLSLSCASGPHAFWGGREDSSTAPPPALALSPCPHWQFQHASPPLHLSQPNQHRTADGHTQQPILGKGLWDTGEALLGPGQPPSLCLCLAQWEAVLPQAMLWDSLRTQGGEHWRCGLLPLQLPHTHPCQHHSSQPQQLQPPEAQDWPPPGQEK
uniref:LIM zinc-binding domain-containing protein n=1 Tax=Equus asinus asinus TaxID=83772 RepID=A0A8C4L1C9_EQUAS